MQDENWWARFTRFESAWSLLGGSTLISAAATIWAAFQKNAPVLSSVEWLLVYIAVTLAVVLIVGVAGWAKTRWAVSGGVASEDSDANASGALEPPVLLFTVRKHVAPRQDDVETGNVRLCVGALLIADENLTFEAVRARVQVSDPNGWTFSDEVFFEGDLHPGEVEDHYPVEIWLESKSKRIKYRTEDGGDFRYLGSGERLEYAVSVSAPNMPQQSYVATVRGVEDEGDLLVLEQSD